MFDPEFEVIPEGMDYEGALNTHNTSYGFCASDPDCPCHEDANLIDDVNEDYQQGLLSANDASNIVKGWTF